MLARAAGWLDKAAFSPDTLPDDLVIGLALTPTVIVGLIIFKLAALEMLLVALAIGIPALLVPRLLWRKFNPRPEASPLIAAIVGVALVGPGAHLSTSIEIAAGAVILELLRARYTPAVHAQAGLIAYALVALITRGAPFAYLRPADGTAGPDPIAIWFLQPSLPSSYDPITLYVGNVAGPVFATSLMAVGIGVAWLIYARRLSPIVAICFLLGAIVPISWFHWDFVSQLDSGPTWFVGAIILSDRRLLPGSWAARPILGFAAGLFAVGLRHRGGGIEAAFYTVAAVQAITAIVVVALWTIKAWMQRRARMRLLQRREMQLRTVNQAEEPADPSAVA